MPMSARTLGASVGRIALTQSLAMAQRLLLKGKPRPGELRADERVLADSRAHSHAEPVEGRSAAHTIGNWTLANRAPAGVFVLSSVQILRQTSTDREMRKGPAGFG